MENLSHKYAIQTNKYEKTSFFDSHGLRPIRGVSIFPKQ
jgi:hypothetical protein